MITTEALKWAPMKPATRAAPEITEQYLRFLYNFLQIAATEMDGDQSLGISLRFL